MKREQRRFGGGEILLSAGDGEEFGVQLNRSGGVSLHWSSGLVIDYCHFSLEEGTFLVDAQKFETLAAFGDQVEAAVGILFHYGDDFGSASYLGQALLDGADYAEGAMLGEAFADHFFVTRFEDVQGQGSVGEQNDIEREQG
jgi:hypothetical protein